MSVMTTQLGARRIGALHDAVADAAVADSVADLRPGQQARVIHICDEADAATARRFFDLGFAPGAEIIAVRRAPMRGPIVVRVAGYEIALRRAQAQCIKVAELS